MYCPNRDCCSGFRQHFENCEKIALTAAQAHHVDQQIFHEQAEEIDYEDQWCSLRFVQCPAYAINKVGHVRNNETNRIVSGSVNVRPDQSERRIKLIDSNGSERKFRVHILVACAFLPPSKHATWTSVYHLDSDRSNCHLDNLY